VLEVFSEDADQEQIQRVLNRLSNAPVVYVWLGRYPLKVEKADHRRPGVPSSENQVTMISDFTSGGLKFQSITRDKVQVRIYRNMAVETDRSIPDFFLLSLLILSLHLL
jgi:hypothetical protein